MHACVDFLVNISCTLGRKKMITRAESREIVYENRSTHSDSFVPGVTIAGMDHGKKLAGSSTRTVILCFAKHLVQ